MINIRLSPEHIAYVINHAEDEILLVDDNLFPHLAQLAPMLKTVKHYVIMGDSTEVPETTLSKTSIRTKRFLPRRLTNMYFLKILMKIHQQVCVTRPLRRVIRKVSSIHIADLYFIVTLLDLRIPWGCVSVTLALPLFQCSMRTPGECRLRQSFRDNTSTAGTGFQSSTHSRFN